MKPGPELDALVAEKVMSINLKPAYDYALARVGSSYVAVTGPVFQLRHPLSGKDLDLPMTSGESLPAVEGGHWNDRYYAEVARHLLNFGDKVASKVRDEVEDYREKAKPYSTDIAAAWEVVDKLAVGGRWLIANRLGHFNASFAPISGPQVQSDSQGMSHPQSIPHAICLAAIAAAGVELKGEEE